MSEEDIRRYREDDWIDARRYREVIGILGIEKGQLMTYIDALYESLRLEREKVERLEKK